MRKIVLLAVLAITGDIAMAPTAEAQTQPFSASFKGNQRLNEPPCAAGVLCGIGSISGFGDATYSALPVDLGPVAGSCQPLTALVSVDLSGRDGFAHAVGGRRTVLAGHVGRRSWCAAVVRQPGSYRRPLRGHRWNRGLRRGRGKWLGHPAGSPARRTSSRFRECSISRQSPVTRQFARGLNPVLSPLPNRANVGDRPHILLGWSRGS